MTEEYLYCVQMPSPFIWLKTRVELEPLERQLIAYLIKSYAEETDSVTGFHAEMAQFFAVTEAQIHTALSSLVEKEMLFPLCQGTEGAVWNIYLDDKHRVEVL